LRQQPLDIRQPGADDIMDRLIHCLGKSLLEAAYDQIRAAHDLPGIRFQGPHDEIQCRRLARTIAADQTDALPGVDRELGLTKNRQISEPQQNIFESY
jgi:hypothetical protein